MTGAAADIMRATAGFNRKMTQKGQKYALGLDNFRNRNSGKLPDWTTVKDCQLKHASKDGPAGKRMLGEPPSAIKTVYNSFDAIRAENNS